MYNDKFDAVEALRNSNPEIGSAADVIWGRLSMLDGAINVLEGVANMMAPRETQNYTEQAPAYDPVAEATQILMAENARMQAVTQSREDIQSYAVEGSELRSQAGVETPSVYPETTPSTYLHPDVARALDARNNPFPEQPYNNNPAIGG